MSIGDILNGANSQDPAAVEQLVQIQANPDNIIAFCEYIQQTSGNDQLLALTALKAQLKMKIKIKQCHWEALYTTMPQVIANSSGTVQTIAYAVYQICIQHSPMTMFKCLLSQLTAEPDRVNYQLLQIVLSRKIPPIRDQVYETFVDQVALPFIHGNASVQENTELYLQLLQHTISEGLSLEFGSMVREGEDFSIQLACRMIRVYKLHKTQMTKYVFSKNILGQFQQIFPRLFQEVLDKYSRCQTLGAPETDLVAYIRFIACALQCDLVGDAGLVQDILLYTAELLNAYFGYLVQGQQTYGSLGEIQFASDCVELQLFTARQYLEQDTIPDQCFSLF